MEIQEYIEMTYDEIGRLDRESTVFMSSVSPVETHGPHLPMGTDLFIADEIRDRTIDRLKKSHPGLTIVLLPRLNIGAGAIPVAGSFPVRYQALLFSVFDMGKALADMGFKYWLLTDNHGGPSHQVGIELAARRLARKGFTLIAPFHESFRRMIARDPDLLEKTGLPGNAVGAPDDAHAGTNETSLMLAAHPKKVREAWKTLGRAKESPMTLLPKILHGVSKILEKAGAQDAAHDFYFMAHGFAWVSDPDMDPYQGTPENASPEAGEAMLDYRADLAHELLSKALAGEKIRLKPMGWSARFLRDIM